MVAGLFFQFQFKLVPVHLPLHRQRHPKILFGDEFLLGDDARKVFVGGFFFHNYNLLAELIRLSCKKIISQIHFIQRG